MVTLATGGKQNLSACIFDVVTSCACALEMHIWQAIEASETLSGLFNRESRIYIAYYTSKSGIWLVIS